MSLGAVRAAIGYGPLLQMARSLFEPAELRRFLATDLGHGAAGDCGAITETEAIILDWLAESGKRFRPFITLASYSAMRRHQGQAPGPAAAEAIPHAVKCVAVAMEILHKASLVHDDAEDEDDYRYGRPTIHARYGVPTAINSGDHLVGLGYWLVAAQQAALGSDCTCDILARLSDAHLKLCRGQGAELLLTRERRRARPADVLAIYALKTAPAFAVAMCAGMRMAGPIGYDGERVTDFCRHLGVGYQILDDLDDLRLEAAQEQPLGQDFLRHRPTILRAMASEAGADGQLDLLLRDALNVSTSELIGQLRQVYEQSGAIDQAQRLVGQCQRRALKTAGEVESAVLRDLMIFLLGAVLGPDKIYSGNA